MKKKLLLYKFRICKVAAFYVGGGVGRMGLGGKWGCMENVIARKMGLHGKWGWVGRKLACGTIGKQEKRKPTAHRLP